MPEIVQTLATALMQHQRKPDMGGGVKRPAGKRLVRFWAQDARRPRAARTVPLDREVRYAGR